MHHSPHFAWKIEQDNRLKINQSDQKPQLQPVFFALTLPCLALPHPVDMTANPTMEQIITRPMKRAMNERFFCIYHKYTPSDVNRIKPVL
jgi:hypothetical protein